MNIVQVNICRQWIVILGGKFKAFSILITHKQNEKQMSLIQGANKYQQSQQERQQEIETAARCSDTHL